MNKTALKISLCFSITAAVIATLLLCINFLGFAALSSDSSRLHGSPQGLLTQIHSQLTYTDGTFHLSEDVIIPDDSWCIVINENGDIVWSIHQPSDIPTHYSINDIASMTKWFLNDYPVYVWTEDYGLLVLGMPKSSIAKYELEYTMKWFDTLPRRILTILIINLVLAAIFACLLGGGLFKRLKEFINGVNDLRLEKNVRLREKGLFKELSKNINETSLSIARKNTILAAKDEARSNWIAGISHDIRTPLSIIMGNAEALEDENDLSAINKGKASTILAQSVRIKKLVEDLNLISALEYDMQPTKRSTVPLCPFLRRITSDIINNDLPDCYEIELNLEDEGMSVFIDEPLMERAVYNLIHNSITHNPEGCHIIIAAHRTGDTAIIIIHDTGCGVPEDVLQKITKIPQTTHGLGLPMAYKIVAVHGGKLLAENNNGFRVNIELPLT